MASYPWIVRLAAEKLTKGLMGLHASFDPSMVLLQDVVQALDRPVATPAVQDSFPFHF